VSFLSHPLFDHSIIVLFHSFFDSFFFLLLFSLSLSHSSFTFFPNSLYIIDYFKSIFLIPFLFSLFHSPSFTSFLVSFLSHPLFDHSIIVLFHSFFNSFFLSFLTDTSLFLSYFPPPFFYSWFHFANCTFFFLSFFLTRCVSFSLYLGTFSSSWIQICRTALRTQAK